MNALTQYLDLYREHCSLLDSRSARPLNELRPRAAAVLEKMTLPPLGSENYHITDLQKLLAPDFGLNIARVPIDVNPLRSFHCGVPAVSTAQIFVLNDICVRPEGANLPDPDSGVYIGSLAEAAEKMPHIVSEYYGRLADIDNPIVALDTLLCQDGVMVYVPDGVRLERPLQIVNILQNGAPLMAVRRLLVVLGHGAEATILTCDHTQNPEVDFASLQTIEVFAGDDSRLDIYDLEESTRRTTRLSALYLRQGARSNVLIDGCTLFNGNTRNEYHCRLAGEEGTLRLLGMAIEDDDRRADTYSVIRHEVPRCNADELFKYVVDDRAAGCFGGLIYVAPGAVKTEAYQSNRNLVGSPQARMYSKPQLEIYNDDVKCSHGTATGTLDEMQIFYMRSRGLSLPQARLLLKQAFMADVIDGVRMPGLKERLIKLVERRFAGHDASCSACHAECDKQF